MNSRAKRSSVSFSVSDPGHHEKGQFFTVTWGLVLSDHKQGWQLLVPPSPKTIPWTFPGPWDCPARTTDMMPVNRVGVANGWRG